MATRCNLNMVYSPYTRRLSQDRTRLYPWRPCLSLKYRLIMKGPTAPIRLM